jgi:hypothetical protein
MSVQVTSTTNNGDSITVTAINTETGKTASATSSHGSGFFSNSVTQATTSATYDAVHKVK